MLLYSVLLIRIFPDRESSPPCPKRHAFIFFFFSSALPFSFLLLLLLLPTPSSSLLSFNSSSSTTTTALSLSSCLLTGARGSILQAQVVVVVILLFGPPSNPTAVTSTAGKMSLSSPIREMVIIIMSLFFIMLNINWIVYFNSSFSHHLPTATGCWPEPCRFTNVHSRTTVYAGKDYQVCHSRPAFIFDSTKLTCSSAHSFMAHPETLLPMSAIDDPLERFVSVVRFYLSGWHIKPPYVSRFHTPSLWSIGALF